MKSVYRLKQEAREAAAKALEKTKQRLGIGAPGPLQGAQPSPLEADPWQRMPSLAPTSDRIPGPAGASDFMHAHKWKPDAAEAPATVKEIRRKASKIAPAYNKGALQYLPDEER